MVLVIIAFLFNTTKPSDLEILADPMVLLGPEILLSRKGLLGCRALRGHRGTLSLSHLS